jgi:DNA-binding response OmpR family regulator
VVDPPAQTRNILVVDDSADYVGFVQSFLEAEGFQVDTALTTEAMQILLRSHTPDMVISDVRIPGDEAFAVLNILRADARTSGIPVLLCTAALQEVEESSERLRQEGVEILFKPFDVDVLLDHVRRLTRMQEAPRV